MDATRSGEPRWWAFRRAGSLEPATYRCPFCDGYLHATSDHLLIAPEGDASRRRHVHDECFAAARRDGRLPTYDEWHATQPARRGLVGRLFGRR